jgi:hypothetical protein
MSSVDDLRVASIKIDEVQEMVKEQEKKSKFVYDCNNIELSSRNIWHVHTLFML